MDGFGNTVIFSCLLVFHNLCPVMFMCVRMVPRTYIRKNKNGMTFRHCSIRYIFFEKIFVYVHNFPFFIIKISWQFIKLGIILFFTRWGVSAGTIKVEKCWKDFIVDRVFPLCIPVYIKIIRLVSVTFQTYFITNYCFVLVQGSSFDVTSWHLF